MWPCQDAAMTERFEVQRTIPADPATIFGVVSSPSGHVQIDASGMLQSYTGEPATARRAGVQGAIELGATVHFNEGGEAARARGP